MAKLNAKKPVGSYKKLPFEGGRAGSKFLPSKFGEDRGNAESWANKLPQPPKKGSK